MHLSNTQLFRGLEEEEITSLLRCLHAAERSYKKGEMILPEGSMTEQIGIVLSGMAVISCSDIWGNTSILGNVAAVEHTAVLFLTVGSILTSCTNACPFHARMARNLLTVCAHKSLQLSRRIQHTSSKSIRGRLMSYFSECAKSAGSNSFLLPYNRQQLADYLNVDRSAMCNELSKMKKDGVLDYERNRILLLT